MRKNRQLEIIGTLVVRRTKTGIHLSGSGWDVIVNSVLSVITDASSGKLLPQVEQQRRTGSRPKRTGE